MKKLFFSLALLISSIGSFSFGQNCGFTRSQGDNPLYDPLPCNIKSDYKAINNQDRMGILFYPLIIIGAIGLSYGIFLGIKKYKSKIGKLSDSSPDELGKL